MARFLLLGFALTANYFIFSHSASAFVVDGNNFLDPRNASNAAQAYLREHNKLRARKNVPPLKWSNSLSKKAKDLAQREADKQYEAPPEVLEGYGRNDCAVCEDIKPNPEFDVVTWTVHENLYNYSNNSCIYDPNTCTDYLQVVWKDTTEMGCGQVAATSEMCKGWPFGYLTICLYYPPGNVPSERPY